MRNVATIWFQAGRESASQLARDSGVSPIDRGRNFLRARFIKTALRFCPRPRIPRLFWPDVFQPLPGPVVHLRSLHAGITFKNEFFKVWNFLADSSSRSSPHLWHGNWCTKSLAPQAKILVILKPGMRFSKGKSIIWRSDFLKKCSFDFSGNAASKGKLDIYLFCGECCL